MRLKNIKNTNDAVIGVVVAILLVGLVVAVMSVIQTVYVPKWMEQREAEHMETVVDQFARLKFAIDTQSVIEQNIPIPIATSITLGSKELPFLLSSRAFGSLQIVGDACTVDVSGVYYDNVTKTYNSVPQFSLGIIKFSSVNAYFLNQKYIYEVGAMITSQHDGNVMYIRPSFTVVNSTNVTITFNVINISGVAGKIHGGGYGTTAIQTEFAEVQEVFPADNISMINVTGITITTAYTDAWGTFFNSTLKKAGFNSGTHYWVNETGGGDGVTLEFGSSISKPVELSLQVVKINAQIGPGWIE